MALIINHNMPAMTAARNLGSIYGSLGKSIERLSSGLRINKAADDAAGLAVREMMRADIAGTLQGIRNAADAVSMIQTADGALAVIDAKLIRMKELAEQAATGTYTDFQREIINSEFQAMSAEIDRIANATNFNGIKLLNGSITVNGGAGIRIHFGVNNNAAEDYYYVNTGDVRATSTAGLNIGTDSTNDVWSTGGIPGVEGPTNCCGGAFSSAGQIAVTRKSAGMILGYNWDLYNPAIADDGSSLTVSAALGTHIMGRYTSGSGTTIQTLINQINRGSQSRIQLTIGTNALAATNDSAAVICLSSAEKYYYGSATLASGVAGKTGIYKKLGAATAEALTSSINTNSTRFWAIKSGDNVWVFSRSAGNFDNLTAGYVNTIADRVGRVQFTNMETGQVTSGLGQFGLGGEHWINAVTMPETGTSFNLALVGKDIGEGYDIKVVGAGDATFLSHLVGLGATAAKVVPFTSNLMQMQDATDGRGSIRSQATAQRALETINEAIEHKDQVRANLGAMQNRLEATIENLTVQAENLQASESRISDVDVATEMTEYTKNNILAQAAASMLAQANSLSSLALVLIGG
jgi:flagellin